MIDYEEWTKLEGNVPPTASCDPKLLNKNNTAEKQSDE